MRTRRSRLARKSVTSASRIFAIRRDTLADLGEKKAYVIMFTTLDCPVVQRYVPRLKELDEAYRDKGVQLLAVNVGPSDDLREIAYQALVADVEFPFVKDFDGSVAAAVGATRASEVVVLDADRKLRYRGRSQRSVPPGRRKARCQAWRFEDGDR